MLEKYHKKRNFEKTPEPCGNEKGLNNKHPIFVIQEHHAFHLHYDLRLETSGILKSWAVPKGIPADIHQKHLAILTEDHPLSYANFEGIIPQGEYGGGTVKIWDKGTYENSSVDEKQKQLQLDKALKKGHLLFQLNGKRLKKVKFLLHRFKKDKKEYWFLMRIQQ